MKKINVLWVVNIPTYQYSLNFKLPNLKNGLWLDAISSIFDNQKTFNIHIATIGDTNQLQSVKKGRFSFHMLPGGSAFNYKRSRFQSINDWNKLFNTYKFKHVTIWGTECKHAYYSSLVAKKKKVKISLFLQGILREITKSEYSFENNLLNFKYITLRDLIKFDFFPFNYLRRLKSLVYEKIIINNSHYFFVENSWSISVLKSFRNIKDNQIIKIKLPFNNSIIQHIKNRLAPIHNQTFQILSLNSSNTIKGVHFLLKSLNNLHNKFNFKLYLTGPNPFKKKFYRIDWYSFYIKSLIHKFNLKDKVVFTQNLSQPSFFELLSKSNLFISTSQCENHSSSVKEALFLNIPVISTNVGGINEYFIQNSLNLLINQSCNNLTSSIQVMISEIKSEKNKLLTLDSYDIEGDNKKNAVIFKRFYSEK